MQLEEGDNLKFCLFAMAAVAAAYFLFRAFLMLCIWWTHKYGP